MRHMLCIVGLACLIAGCANNQTPDPQSAGVATKTAITIEQYDRLKERVDDLTREMRELREYLESDPNFFLRMMDLDLDAVERGENPRGSFSDYFMPNARAALYAGATKKDVMARIERVIALAEKKIYLSSFVAQLMEEGGASAIRSYAEGIYRNQRQ